MKKELVFVSDAVPGGIDKSCGLYYYTPALVHRVTFGTDYSIQRFDRINDTGWTCYMKNSTLSFTISTLLEFGPFLAAEEIDTYWAGVKL